MQSYDHLIIGGGMTTHAAVQGITSNQPDASIGVISSEPNSPYWRPPLSKSLWQGDKVDDIWCGTDAQNLHVLKNTTVQHIDPDNYTVTDTGGETYKWGKLLLATGGTPKTLPVNNAEQVIYYRTLQDYYQLQEKIDKANAKVIVAGGGFIGSEIAAALAMNDVNVTMLFPEEGIGGRLFPEELSDFLNEYYRSKGVEVLPGTTVTELREAANGYTVVTGSGEEISGDVVVAGLGIAPNTELAEGAGLETNDGILVNWHLQTKHPDIYAAGDCARFYNPMLDKTIRVEHDDNTQAMGEVAGKNMSGKNESYDYLPMFYSDLFDLGYEAVGETKRDMEIVTQWKTFGKEGIIFYLRDSKVKGAIFWNVWDQVDAGKELLKSNEPMTEEKLATWASEKWGE